MLADMFCAVAVVVLLLIVDLIMFSVTGSARYGGKLPFVYWVWRQSF